MDLSGFNWPEVIVAALSVLVFGHLWYVKLFSERRQALARVSSYRQQRTNLFFGLLFAFALAAALSFFIEFAMMMGSGAITGALFGAMLAIIFCVPTFTISYLFNRQALPLMLIDGSYWVLQFAIMGAIMGAWQ